MQCLRWRKIEKYSPIFANCQVRNQAGERCNEPNEISRVAAATNFKHSQHFIKCTRRAVLSTQKFNRTRKFFIEFTPKVHLTTFGIPTFRRITTANSLQLFINDHVFYDAGNPISIVELRAASEGETT